jgi:hypothetical protein
MTDQTQDQIVAAYQLAMQGDRDHARMVLEEFLYEDAGNIEGWLLMADLSETPEEARQCYQMVLEISPENWIAQQRLRLLFSQENRGVTAVENIFLDDDEEDFPSFEEFDLDAEPVPSEKQLPTLAESFAAHRPLVLGVGGGLALLMILMVGLWLFSIGFVAWRMGYLIIGG